MFQPGSREKFRAEVLRKLPFEAELVLCDGRDLIQLHRDDPFQAKSIEADFVRFVSILSRHRRLQPSIPFRLPSTGPWFVQVIARKGRFVFGVYRRQMKTIGYLGQLDKIFGAPLTTRNWNTITSIIRILKDGNQPHT